MLISLDTLYNYNDISSVKIFNDTYGSNTELIQGCRLILLDESYNIVVTSDIITDTQTEYIYDLNNLYQVSSLNTSPIFYIIQKNADEIQLDNGYLNPADQYITSNVMSNSDPVNILMNQFDVKSVSYTHLTLPTILRV